MKITANIAKKIGDELGINWKKVDLKQFTMGLKVELEHGSKLGSKTNITKDNLVKTGKIALAHLMELPDYYTRLKTIEESVYESISDLLLLFEAKVDLEIQKYKDKKMPEMVAFLETVKSEKIEPKYITWMAKQAEAFLFTNGKNDFLNFTADIFDTIREFDQLVKRKLITGKDSDINTWNSSEEIQEFLAKKTATKNKISLKKDTDKIYEDENYLILEPKSAEASCKYGKGTRWCISAIKDNKFDEHVNEGYRFLFIINKNNNDKDALLLDPETFSLEIYDAVDDVRTSSYISSKYPSHILKIANNFIKMVIGKGPFSVKTFDEYTDMSFKEMVAEGDGSEIANFINIQDIPKSLDRIEKINLIIKTSKKDTTDKRVVDFIENFCLEVANLGEKLAENNSEEYVDRYLAILFNEKYKIHNNRLKIPPYYDTQNALFIKSLSTESQNVIEVQLIPLILGTKFKQAVEKIGLDSITELTGNVLGMLKMYEASWPRLTYFYILNYKKKLDILEMFEQGITVNNDGRNITQSDVEFIKRYLRRDLEVCYEMGNKINWDLRKYIIDKVS